MNNSKFLFAFLFFISPPLIYAGEKSLSLEEAIEKAVQRSPELEKERIRLEKAKLEEPLLLSELDTSIESSYMKSEDEAPRVAPAFEGDRSETENFSVSLVQKTLLGTDARLVWDNIKIENAAPFRILDPSVESSLTLQVRQPLLRYFWGRPDVARRRRYRSAVLAQESYLRYATEQLAYQTAEFYFRLVFSNEKVRIGELAVSEARRLLESYTGKKRFGLIEESDLLQAKASLEAVQADLDLAKSELEKSRYSLKEILRESGAEKENEYAVSFSTSVILPLPRSLTEATERGVAGRGDLESLRYAKESSDWAYRTEKLDTLPDLSFVGSYGGTGLDQSYSGAWDDMNGFDHIVKSAGVNLTVPFGFKKESLLRKSRKLDLKESEQFLREGEDRVVREIQNAWEDVQLQRSRVNARARLFRLQTEKLKSEGAEFERGRSTTDILVRFQQDMFQSELDLSRSKIDTFLSELKLSQVTGLLYEYLVGMEMKSSD